MTPDARHLIRPRGLGRMLHFGHHPWVLLAIIVCVVLLLVALSRRNR